MLFCACLDARAHGQTAAGKQPKKVLALHLIRRDSPAFDDAFRAELNTALSGQLDYYANTSTSHGSATRGTTLRSATTCASVTSPLTAWIW